MTQTREEALAKLLAPIEWHWTTRLPGRQSEVCRRHALVGAAYPFMTPEEQAQAQAWFKREAHSGLWD